MPTSRIHMVANAWNGVTVYTPPGAAARLLFAFLKVRPSVREPRVVRMRQGGPFALQWILDGPDTCRLISWLGESRVGKHMRLEARRLRAGLLKHC